MATNAGPRTLSRAIRRVRWQSSGAIRWHGTMPATVEQNEPEPYPYIPHTPPPSSQQSTGRRQAVQNAKPFSDFLTDTFNRQHDYLRISVTERCNLRCLYCMPEEGIQLSPNKELLTSAEIYYLCALFVNQGVNKIRLTGGEPTIRKDIVPLMQQIGSLRRNGLKEMALTTNGISLHRKLDAMVEAGLTGVNISLDTLDPFQFQLLTRRQGFDAVMKSINRVKEMNQVGAGVKLKLNAVVMRGLNDHQIMPFVEKTRDEDIEVRFIEYMPFGGNKWSQKKMMPYSEMLDSIREKYPDIARLKGEKNDTSKTWQVPGFKGRIGFITSMTHNFCGTCNRLRITSDGNLKVCLHGNTEVSLRDLLRKENNGDPLDEAAFEAIRQIELDRRKSSDLQFDGEEGWMSKEQQLLDVIGAAVKRKKAKHAGMGELENMKNRPMILIDEHAATKSNSHFSSFSKRSNLTSQPKPPWSSVPLHMLTPPTTSFAQIRNSSSDSRNSSDDGAQPSTNDDKASSQEDQPSSSFASAFGFQSLTGLFSDQAPRRRYSRPEESRSESVVRSSNASLEGRNEAVQQQHDVDRAQNSTSGVGSTYFSTSMPSSADVAPAQATESVTRGQRYTPPQEEAIETSSPYRAVPSGFDGPMIKKFVASAGAWPKPTLEPNFQGEQGLTVPRPAPGRRERIARRLRQQSQSQSQSQSQPSRPWGLSRDDMKTVDSLADPSAVSPNVETRAPVVANPTRKTDDQGLNNAKAQKAQKLTHLTASGEAHMVDVGAKPASRRVAIAISNVRFSNPEPFRLIFENKNQKGDVLGVARVAGIMAAKRTADLIPLCHPISISKTEVDITLGAPGGLVPFSHSRTKSLYGYVAVRALVECTGPTGVEMEALTAASCASLTVYDMCKAVDREANIRNTKVVYKSGGKSGITADRHWGRAVGKDFFVERDLEIPDDVLKAVHNGGKKASEGDDDGD